MIRLLRGLVRSARGPASLPDAEEVQLPGGAATWAIRLAGPHPGAPTLLLVHGLGATAYLNWYTAFPRLAERFNVVAVDLPIRVGSHGRRRFRLRDCADDTAAAAHVLGVERAIVVGYSMGGPIAQLIWRHHPELVGGLVLCATSRNFSGKTGERLFFTLLPGALGTVGLARRLMRPGRPAAPVLRPHRTYQGQRQMPGWAFDELRRSSPGVVFEGVAAIGRFSSHRWIDQVDVPTAVVVTTRDRCIPPSRQLKLAAAIPGATVHPIDGGHASCAFAADFGKVLAEACGSVADRLELDVPEAPPAPA